MKHRLLIGLSIVLGISGISLAQMMGPPLMTVTPDKESGIYSSGDTVHWKLTWTGSGDAPASVHYVLKGGGQKQIGDGDLKLTDKSATFDSKFDEPNTVLVNVTWGSTAAAHAVGGAVADPYKIRPAASEPADFEAFWKQKLADLKKIPPNAKLTPEDSGKPGVTYEKITLDNINNTHVQGQIARPEKGEKFPAIFIPQWAGVYALQKGWVTDLAHNGWLALNVEAHDIPIDYPPDYYTKLYGPGGDLQNYWKIGNTDKNTSYYLRMYLSCCQAIEYLKTRPDWDGKTIVVMGGSQGGQQSLVTAGLYPDQVTAALALIPAACDNWAESIGRRSGFPFWWDQTDNRDANAVHETSKYFDPVYFAKRIKCPVLCGCGLHDDVAPPSSILAAFNQISSSKQILIMPQASHQDIGAQKAYYDRAYSVWLPALVQGKTPPTK